jgi:hypothetical protein
MTRAPGDPEEQETGGRRREPEVEEAFDRLVSEGSNRLDRPLVPLLATGFVGGIDVGVGVLAYLVVDHETGQPLPSRCRTCDRSPRRSAVITPP